MLSFLTLVALLSPSFSNSVVNIIYKNQIPSTLLSSGIIATERYVVTTRYPLINYVSSSLCVLPSTNLLTITRDHMSTYCIDIKNISISHSTNVSFALIELSRELAFPYMVNTAAIPMTHKIESFDHCRLIYNKFEEFDGNKYAVGQDWMTINVTQTDAGLVGKLSYEKTFCMRDSGLPLLCDGADVAILAFHHNSTLGVCQEECKKNNSVKFSKLIDWQAQVILKKYIERSYD